MPAEPTEKRSKGLGVKKAAGLKRTRTGCAECRRRRTKCGEQKPSCSSCVKAGSECLYPLDLPKDVLFQPYERQQQVIASTSYLAPTPSTPTASPTSVNAVASSSRLSPAESSVGWALETGDLLYKTPKGLLEIAYPDPEERHLIYHFLSFLPKLVITPFPTPNTTVGEADHTSLMLPGRYPITSSLANLTPHFDVVAFLANRQHSTTAEEALSLALLSVGAVHLSYLHHQSATTFLFDSPENPALAQASDDAHLRYCELSKSLVDASLALTRSSMLLLGARKQRMHSWEEELDEEDSALSSMSIATDACLLTRCLQGGGNFSEALLLAKVLVGMRGGPLKMLQQAKRTGDPTKLRRSRVILEEIVMWEIFSCLSTGRAPDLVFPKGLSSHFGPASLESSPSLSSWYSAFAPAPGTPRAGSGDGDWETVEGLLGISRGLVEILHRINSLYARSRPADWSALEPTANYPLEIDPVYVAEARALLAETEIWKSAFAVSKSVDEMTRLDLGNVIYTNTMDIILQLDLFGYPPSHPEVQSRAKEIVQLVLRCFESNGFVLGFIWPLICSASCSTTDEDRSLARSALQTLRSVCCFDLNSAWELLDRVWEKRDAGDLWASWRSVTGEGGGLILI